MTNDSQNDLLRPNTMVATPKPTTAQSIERPAFLMGGMWAMGRAAADAPTSGPTIDAIWKKLLFQVAALLKVSAGTICGSRDERAGQPVACAAALRPSSRYIDHTGPCRWDTSVSPSAEAAHIACVMMMIRR